MALCMPGRKFGMVPKPRMLLLPQGMKGQRRMEKLGVPEASGRAPCRQHQGWAARTRGPSRYLGRAEDAQQGCCSHVCVA